ncbi:helix-turn-helix domain-containing protein [Aquirufa sp. ROCK-SH2]
MIPLILGISIPVLSFILILFNWNKKNYSKFLFAYYLFTGILSLVIYHNFSNPQPAGLLIFYLNFSPLLLLNGVFFYFYLISKLENKNILENKWNYLHFIPSFVQFISISKYYWMDKEEKMKYILMLHKNPNLIFRLQIPGVYLNKIESFLARPLLLFVYSMIGIYWLIKKKPLTNMSFNPRETTAKKNEFKFIWILAIINCLFAIAMFSSFLYNYQNPSIETLTFKILKFSLIITTFFQVGSLLFSPNILYGIITLDKKPSKIKNSLGLNEEDIPEDLKNISNKFLEYIEKEEPYLNPNFNKSELLIALKISPKQLNDIFEFVIQQSFPAYKNTLRVNYAKKILSEGAADKLTMDGIGLNAGFASRSSFYAIFKAETGYTPVEFVEKLRE